MAQVTKNTIHYILAYAAQGKHFPLTVNELQQLAYLAGRQLASPAKADGDEREAAGGIQRYGAFMVDRYPGDGSGERETDVQMRPQQNGEWVKYDDHVAALSSPAKVGGDEPLEISERHALDSACADIAAVHLALGLPEEDAGGVDAALEAIAALLARAALSADGGARKDAETSSTPSLSARALSVLKSLVALKRHDPNARFGRHSASYTVNVPKALLENAEAILSAKTKGDA